MNNSLSQKLGTFIRDKRKQIKWSQEDLAFRSDLSTNYIRKIEKGIVNPSLATLRKIARALDLELAAMIQNI